MEFNNAVSAALSWINILVQNSCHLSDAKEYENSLESEIYIFKLIQLILLLLQQYYC